MLKLIKYEFIHSFRTYIVAFAVFLVGCFAMPIVGNYETFGDSYSIIMVILNMGWWFLLLGIAIALVVSLFKNFATSMFKKPGYLTLTLPVTSFQLVVAKTIAGILWLCIGGLVLILGIIIAMISVDMTYDGVDLSFLFKSGGKLIKEFFNMVGTYPKEFIETLLNLFGQAFMLVSTIFLTVTIVHTRWFLKHKAVFGIIWYFIINLFTGWVLGKVSGTYVSNGFVSFTFGIMGDVTSTSMLPQALITILLGCIFTAITIYFVDHHIELE